MGKAGVKTFCYNWMPATDWSRTSVTTPTRGGALVSEFNIDKKEADLDASVKGYRN